ANESNPRRIRETTGRAFNRLGKTIRDDVNSLTRSQILFVCFAADGDNVKSLQQEKFTSLCNHTSEACPKPLAQLAGALTDRQQVRTGNIIEVQNRIGPTPQVESVGRDQIVQPDEIVIFETFSNKRLVRGIRPMIEVTYESGI